MNGMRQGNSSKTVAQLVVMKDLFLHYNQTALLVFVWHRPVLFCKRCKGFDCLIKHLQNMKVFC
jgi:hypothetical protein